MTAIMIMMMLVEKSKQKDCQLHKIKHFLQQITRWLNEITRQ